MFEQDKPLTAEERAAIFKQLSEEDARTPEGEIRGKLFASIDDARKKMVRAEMEGKSEELSMISLELIKELVDGIQEIARIDASNGKDRSQNTVYTGITIRLVGDQYITGVEVPDSVKEKMKAIHTIIEPVLFPKSKK